MAKALYKVSVQVKGEKLPHIFQFTNEKAAWDFYYAAKGANGVENVTHSTWPTTLHSKAETAIQSLALIIR